jgi:hypothetical protein
VFLPVRCHPQDNTETLEKSMCWKVCIFSLKDIPGLFLASTNHEKNTLYWFFRWKNAYFVNTCITDSILFVQLSNVKYV